MGLMTLTRTGDSSQPLTINYSLSGQVTHQGTGTDYSSSPDIQNVSGPSNTGSITFAAGQDRINLKIMPVQEHVLEPDEILIVT